MKVSEIAQPDILNHIREIPENMEGQDLKLLDTMKTAAIAYVKSYTGLTEEEMDRHEDLTVAVLSLIADMWDNRSATVQNGKSNMIVDVILGMHAMNLLPSADEEEDT